MNIKTNFFLFFYFFVYMFERKSLCNPGWSRTFYVDWSGLQLRDVPKC